ncbi:MAG TPA: methyltransferase, TIGR04325 family [Roseomonas sp.]|jgi:putative methyltransferase (TIGR04325 family)
MALIKKIRLRQIRFSARMANGLCRLPGGGPAFRALRRWGMTRRVVDSVLGYHRAFPTLVAASAYAAPYANRGHENPGNAHWHMGTLGITQDSDYAVLLFMEINRKYIKSIFDLGGNMGNLFYRYDSYLHFDDTLSWVVCDLPDNISYGISHAKKAGESRIAFTDDVRRMSGCDLLLISGALHYFEDPVAILSSMAEKPKFVIVNRTPLTDLPSYAAVQDNGPFVTACAVHNRTSLLEGLGRLGYRLRDQWSAYEFQIRIAGDPLRSVPHYSGFFMEWQAPASASSP